MKGSLTREVELLKNHYTEAAAFISQYSKESLLEEKAVNLTDTHWLFDYGKHSLIVSHEGNHYKVYSQDYNYRVVFQTKDGISFSGIAQFTRAFFRWRNGSAQYKIFTLSKSLPQEAINTLQQAKFWYPDQVVSDLIYIYKCKKGM